MRQIQIEEVNSFNQLRIKCPRATIDLYSNIAIAEALLYYARLAQAL